MLLNSGECRVGDKEVLGGLEVEGWGKEVACAVKAWEQDERGGSCCHELLSIVRLQQDSTWVLKGLF